MPPAPPGGHKREANALAEDLARLNSYMLKCGFAPDDLKKCYDASPCILTTDKNHLSYLKVFVALVIGFAAIFLAIGYSPNNLLDYVLGIRCLVPNNYLVWEVTRPISDCSFCKNVSEPIILHNITREGFKKYAYTPGPIIVKGAVSHWEAMQKFNYDMFKDLYEHTEGAYESVEEGCQFLHFKSDLFSLREVFAMSEERAKNLDGEKPWYVGWGNCHPDILSIIRKYYNYPEFLPEDAELPNSENVFFGYEQGAVMHLDYIPRLMWQGQIKGNKTWSLAPIPECDNICRPFKFYVEPGDAVLLDTRVWYHATHIPSGQFSLTIQSEYG